MDSTLEEMARAAELEDPRAYRRVAEAATACAESSRNRYVRWLLPGLIEAGASRDELHARFRLIQAALALEQHKATKGRYPAALPSKPGLEDPFAWPATLRYKTSSTGTVYTLWSVGTDEQDNGGVSPKDLVLQRSP